MRQTMFTTETQSHGGIFRKRSLNTALLFSLISLCLCVSVVKIHAQETVPAPGAERSVAVPSVKEVKLKNGLTVAVIEKKGIPLVTVELLVKNGASVEDPKKAGLANLTADLLTKGTKTRSATQIAEDMEFLGASIFSSAGWQSSTLGVSVTSDKFDKAMDIFADVALNPSFAEDELKLAKSQALDELTYNLTQPGFLGNYVAAKFSFGEHPAGGTPNSIEAISRTDVAGFYQKNYLPAEAVLIFVGDISSQKAIATAEKYFGNWQGEMSGSGSTKGMTASTGTDKEVVARFLVVDMPKSGQASVSYLKPIRGIGRASKEFYPASVLNSVLGGGYSSRLNQEIRIKRGLSYGAGSGFGWRAGRANFSTRTQTKNESAAQVAELVIAEIKRLADTTAEDDELIPRKSSLTGGFGRTLETTQGLAGALADLYTFGIPPSELNKYTAGVNAVKAADVRSFAAADLFGGDMIIVGDYSVFKDDLAKRFPNAQINVVKADELDLDSESLRKGDLK